jgi:hypothetical protein
MIGRIAPKVILNQNLRSCTEWHGEEKGKTVYYNSKGLPAYFHFQADVLDTNQKIVTGDFGKREFFYDEDGNLVQSTVSTYEPTLDSSILISMIKNYYDNNFIVKKEHFDNPESKPTVTKYFYRDTLLVREIKSKSDTSLDFETAEKFKQESAVYRYDDTQKLSTILNFRESHLLDSISITYHNDTTIWTTFDILNNEESVVGIIYDHDKREKERVYPDQRKVHWLYDENGLLESIEYTNLETGEIRRTEFTYEK